MLYANGTFMDHWEKDASVPDMSRLETRMWFYFLATAYIDVGIEAIHFGQAGLMDLNDPNHAAWLEVLGRVRSYAHEHARRHLLICDAHAPKGGFVENGKLLFDFHSFPLRISEVPDKPWTGVLNVGYTDSIVQRSMGGITPSGWSCDHLPYLVEFDNFSVSDHPGRPAQWPFIWGWDEITWFALKPEAERDAWLRYAWDWLARTDPNGHLEMPGSRAITPERPGKSDWYYANTKSFACPSGYNTEDTIKAIWGPIRQPPANAGADLARFINPFIGTDRDGNTFPGSVSPFGSEQFTPNLAGNGYYYPDTHMHGFVVNHMSGDGGANEGEVLMTATTGPVRIDRASTDYHFDHDHESASAGYYQVLMQPWKINAELTTTVHCGFARFTFPAGQQGNILLPLSYVNNPPSLSSHVRYVDGRTVEGDVDTVAFNGLHQGITVYFAMKFSKPFEKHGTWTNTTLTENSNSASQDDRETIIGFYGSYPAADAPQEVDVRVGVSYVDAAGARANLDAEMPADDFERYHQQAVADWNKELHLIDAEGGTFAHHRIFYTALYHCLIDPQIADDVDGRYRGFDDQIHHVPEGHQHFYTTFSGWDIYRSEIPLLTIIEPERVQDMAQSLVEEYEQIGYIDRWSQRSRPTAIMNGDPLTICLVNIWNAGLHNFDINTAYEAMFKQCVPGDIHSYLTDYELYEEEKNGITINPDAAVATALEHELAFAALGNLARSLDKPRDAAYLFGRSLQYREMYNPATGFLQRRDREGRWDPGFGGYTEGDEWIYLWFVNHDVQGLVDLLGGTTAFDRRLDEFFNDKHRNVILCKPTDFLTAPRNVAESRQLRG